MSWLWVIFLLIGGVAGWVLKAVEEEDAATLLRRIPFAILALAAARLPRELRDQLAPEWRTELQFILRTTEGRPRNRLWRGSRYAVGLLNSAPTVADELRGDSRRVLRAARLFGTAAATSCAAWVSLMSYDSVNATARLCCIRVPAALPAFGPSLGAKLKLPAFGPSIGARLKLPAFGPSLGAKLNLHWVSVGSSHLASQEMMLAVSYAVGASALLCLAAWLATAWQPLVYVGGATCVAAEILHFLGGGGRLYLWVSATVFCIVFWVAARQLSGGSARHSASQPLAG